MRKEILLALLFVFGLVACEAPPPMEPVTKLRVSDDEDVLDRYRDEMKEIRRNAFPPVYEESDNGHEATIVIGSDKYEVQLYENRYRKVGADQ